MQFNLSILNAFLCIFLLSKGMVAFPIFLSISLSLLADVIMATGIHFKLFEGKHNRYFSALYYLVNVSAVVLTGYFIASFLFI